MRKRFLIPRRHVPADLESSEDLMQMLHSAGQLDVVLEEMRRRPGGKMQFSAGLRGLYVHVEYPDDPQGVTVTGFLFLVAYNVAMFGGIGYLLAYPDVWIFKSLPRHELFALRGACFGGIGSTWVFVANRFDRALSLPQVVICIAALLCALGVPLYLLVLRLDWLCVPWLAGLAILYRDEWNNWLDDDE